MGYSMVKAYYYIGNTFGMGFHGNIYTARESSYTDSTLASFPGSSGGESRAWYTLFTHAQEFMETQQ